MAETFNNATISLTSTSATDVYQAPNVANTDRSIILSCMVANKNTAAVSITLSITDSSNTLLSTWASGVSVPANASLDAITNKLILKQGQKLRATAGSANQLDVTVSALEIT